MTRNRSDQLGMALMAVLGSFIMLSALAIGLISLTDNQVKLKRVEENRARGAALAEGAIHAAVLSLFEPSGRNHARSNQGWLNVSVAGRALRVRVRDTCALWDLNRGDIAIFAALARHAGVTVPTLLVDTVRRARQVGDGFLSIDQLRGLPGMDERAFATLITEITVNCRSDRIDPEFASPKLLATVPGLMSDGARTIQTARAVGPLPVDLLTAHAHQLSPGPGHSYRIEVRINGSPGAAIHRWAEVTLSHEPRRPFRILFWRTVP
ncbi:MAG: hypothetical protein CMM47_06575 [Rhodospirillaceae bacterium]|nr:hypothetical protein [Rhodospirillaceae bacterium]